MNIAYRVVLGVKRHPMKFVRNTFLAYSAIWTIFSPVSSLFPSFNMHGIWKYIPLIIVSLFLAVLICAEPKQVIIRIKNTNTTVKICIGDLFTQSGQKVISVNEYFDSDIGDSVSPNSLHGKFINSVLGGHSPSFNNLVQQSLDGQSYVEIPRKQGQHRRYAIGTTAVIPTAKDKYYLVALSHTDTNTLKANADVVDLLTALIGLWKSVRIHNNGNPINVPLIGAGLSGVGLPANQLIKVIVISILHETKKNEIADNINIIISPDRFEELNLNEMSKELG